MQNMWLHLEKVVSVDAIQWLFAIILAVKVLLTLIHSLQELKGRPWRYFSAIVGVPVLDILGIPTFFVGLTGLWVLAVVGIAGWFPLVGPIPTSTAVFAVAVLIGGRLSDSWFSHIRLDRQGYSPNPGLKSTPYYVAEAVVLAALFAPGLWRSKLAAVLGFALGGLLFFAVLPALRPLRVLPFLRRKPWRPGEPLPSWVR